MKVILGPYPPPRGGVSLAAKEEFKASPGSFFIGTSEHASVSKYLVLVKKGPFWLDCPRLFLQVFRRRKGIDSIHAHFATTFGYVAYWAKRLLGIPYTVTCHGSDVMVGLRKPITQHTTLMALEKADSVEVVSEALKKILVDEGIKAKKIKVVHWKASKEFMPMKVKKKNQIIFVGTVARVKGIDLLLKAFEIVKGRTDYNLLVVGGVSEGTFYQELQAFVRAKGLGERVKFLGERKDIPELLNESKLFVLPSRSEGYGRSVKEAIACGLPVVATQVGGIPEAVKGCKNCKLVEPESPEEMAKAILESIKKSK